MAPIPASGYSQQPHLTVPQQQQASTLQQKQSSKSSCSNIFLKTLIVMLVLVVIPIFPSQAPDFITQTILTQFWELFHLMFIGIAVCYGLFCKRASSKTYVHETHSRFDSSDAYASIFDNNGLENYSESGERRVIPSWDSQFLHYERKDQARFELVEGEAIRSFQNGAEHFCGFYEKRVMPSWDSQFLHYGYSGQERSNLDESEKSRSFSDINGAENTNELNEREVSHVWNSQYFVGESMVVVANGNCGVEKLDRVDHKPLGLPVRSLRSRVVNAEKPEPIHEDTADSGGYEVRGEKVRGMAPINLGRKFEEASGPCQISWRSRSQRRELGGANTVRLPSHSRPHSVGQLEFGHLKPRSLHKPVSARTSPISSPPNITSPSSSCSSENESIKVPHSEEEEGLTSKVKQSSAESYSETNMQLRYDYEEDTERTPSTQGASHVQGPPHSADEAEPWSFWKNNRSPIVSNSFSSGANLPICSGSPEMPNFRKQDLERLKVDKTPSPQLSQPTEKSVSDAASSVASKTRRSTVGSSSESDKLNKVAAVNGEATFLISKSRAFSIGSSSEISMQESSKDKVKHVTENLEEDTLYKQKPSVNSLVSDVKRPVPAKVLSRGNSVRTFRSRRSYIDRSKRKEDRRKGSGEIDEATFDQFDTVSSVKGEGHADVLDNSDRPVQSSAFSEIELEANQHSVNTNIVESKEKSESKESSESVLINSHTSYDEEEVGSNIVDDADLGSEVDRKAGEFIAKFREQIRLQKIESFRRSSG